MRLSVVIPSYDGAHRLPATIAALARCEPPEGGVELIVVDDGSPAPPDPSILGAFTLGPARLVHRERNGGRAAACNAGLREAEGRIVLVLDDDMSLAAGGLRGHIAAHEREGAPRAVIGRIDLDPAASTTRFARFLAAEERSRHDRMRAAPDALRFTDCLTGHFSASRAVLLDAGGYDESFTRYGFEDIELGWRLARRGVALVYLDDVSTLHRTQHARFDVSCRRQVDVGRMAVVFAKRAQDPEVGRFLRIDARDRAEATAFLRAMNRAHAWARSCPPVGRNALLVTARAAAAVGGAVLPARLRHVVYHIVREMHYAAGIAAGIAETGEA